MKATLLSLLVFALTLCGGLAESSERERNEGYSLLYDLAAKQGDLGKILLVKNAGASVTKLVNDISHSAANLQRQLGSFAREDKRLRLRDPNLPNLETKARAAIASTTTKELLLSSGRDFEVGLLLTQVYALRYGAHLAKQLLDLEEAKERKEFLEQTAKEWEALRARVIQEIAPAGLNLPKISEASRKESAP